MHQNVIEFPRAAAQALPRPSAYPIELFWYDSSRMQRVMRTADRSMIRRQMDSLLRRGIMAEVIDHNGARCGSVHAITTADGTLSFRAFLEGEHWGDD
ncbi:MAG TPA: hypothetical protein DIW20_03645 [Rhodospirillaceae bacterium]|nr:hypothetical protein [Rhodospirillaceae bacterium]